ncbi:hypothetical protein BDV36DRAFT_294663 [Aspergillus pseudocaelatus]|uniref:RING-type domain-containing protein n=1 Tax=Aspergillus pseudocaelatus TaxID=1825620 RepID=A0ABQ6WPG7_9EURO|nr:hypothetical protein BDV36DRAFT_294663 [Aspergillus pseudocaelatus]
MREDMTTSFIDKHTPPPETRPETCLFCREDLAPDASYRQVSRTHYLHSPCISDWMSRGRGYLPCVPPQAGIPPVVSHEAVGHSNRSPVAETASG